MTLKPHHRERLLRLADKLEGKGDFETVHHIDAIAYSLNGGKPDDDAAKRIRTFVEARS